MQCFCKLLCTTDSATLKRPNLTFVADHLEQTPTGTNNKAMKNSFVNVVASQLDWSMDLGVLHPLLKLTEKIFAVAMRHNFVKMKQNLTDNVLFVHCVFGEAKFSQCTCSV